MIRVRGASRMCAVLDDFERGAQNSVALRFLPLQDTGTQRHVRPRRRRGVDVISVGDVRTWTTVSGILPNAASRAAQSTATLQAGDPSTPTIIPRCVVEVDISV